MSTQQPKATPTDPPVRSSALLGVMSLLFLSGGSRQRLETQPHVDKHRKTHEPLLKSLRRGANLSSKLFLGHDAEQLLPCLVGASDQQADHVLVKPVKVFRPRLPIQQFDGAKVIRPRHPVAQCSCATHRNTRNDT